MHHSISNVDDIPLKILNLSVTRWLTNHTHEASNDPSFLEVCFLVHQFHIWVTKVAWFVTLPSLPTSEHILPNLVSIIFLQTGTLLYHGLVGRVKQRECLD